MNIFEILKFNEIEFGKIQSVGEMSIIPILGTSRISDRKIADPEKLHFRATRNYGSMEFENESSNFGIMPSNLVVISEESAQDHCMSDTAIIKPKSKGVWDNACCVQQRQGGFLTGDKKQSSFNILPLELRKSLLKQELREKQEYGKLWGDISKWLQNIPKVKADAAHIEYFFKPYRKELEDFVAEFEPVENQIGSLIYFGSECVGMEIMPNEKYWDYYWKWIVRGCYGSEFKRRQLLNLGFKSKVELPELKPQSDKLEANIDLYINSIKNQLIKNVPMIEEGDKKQYKKMFNGLVKYDIIDTKEIKGDVISYDKNPIYTSIVF